MAIDKYLWSDFPEEAPAKAPSRGPTDCCYCKWEGGVATGVAFCDILGAQRRWFCRYHAQQLELHGAEVTYVGGD